MSKTRITIILASVIVIGGLIAIFAIPQKQEQIAVDPEFRNYVSAFTAGVIPKDATIRVQMQSSIADSSMIGKEVEEELFDFSPKVEGKAYWVDRYTVEFKPDKYLEADQIYNAEFFLDKLIDIPKEYKIMEFSFRTVKQSMEVRVGNLKFLPGKQVKWLKLTGKVLTADVEDLDKLKETVVVKQDGKKLKIDWISSEQSRIFNFEIDSIQRYKKESEISIKWNGKEINAEQDGEESLTIIPLGEFKLRNVKVQNQPDQQLVLEFSDPLDPKQDLTGLISLSGNDIQTVIDQNIITIYPEKAFYGKKSLYVNGGLKNILDKKLENSIKKTIEFENLEPDLRIKGKGVIMPSSNGLIFPFESVNLRAVDLTIYQIYENNILQFLQENELDENSNLSRVAKIVYRGTVSLNSTDNAVTDYSNWNNFAIDLSKFINSDKGAIYRVQINLRKEYSTYPCEDTEQDNMMPIISKEHDVDEDEPEYDDWGYYRLYREYGEYPSDYSWRERNNPCHSSYYYRKSYSKNILASDLGIMVKRGKDNKNLVFVTDLVTAEPLSGIKVEAYDYQQQLIKSASTNSDGMATIESRKKPFVVMAYRNNERGYLKMNDGLSNSLSKFDVSGAGLQKGLNGFIYGERGVWRPGDTLFISFMLEDNLKKLPSDIPAVCEFYTPRGQLYERKVNSSPVNMLYDFQLKTSSEDETGMWKVVVKVGNAEFTEYVRIETIKPNRLKINLNFKEDVIKRWDIKPGELEVEWMHGGTASNLKAISEVTLRPLKAEFENFEDYSFQDVAKQFHAETFTVFEGKIDAEGKAMVVPNFNLERSAPGILNAHFETRVFEPGGNSSINTKNFTYYPYRSYAGLKLEGGSNWYEPLETGEKNTIEICNIDADGKGISSNTLKVKIYKLTHSWWYDYSGSRLERLLNDKYNEPYASGKAEVSNGKAKFSFKINKPDHGRYFIRVMDMNSGHSTGRMVYISGYNWWQNDENKDFASLLIFKSNQEKYQTGDKVELHIPSSEGAKILVSLENGMEVMHTEWIDAKDGETVYKFKATKDMAPSVYAHVTMIQPHDQTENDLPIRLYGVIPINIEAPETHLHPEIECAESFKPESKATIKVSEKNGKDMTYTLAIVDEGLLDLTNFKTPDPWNHFYKRQALGVKTWDLYDYVIGSFGGKINRILAIGGGGYAEIDKDKGEVNRFKPMVRYLGPFELKGRKTNKHTINIPQYIGRVRVMVVAGQDKAYGNAEKSVKVKSPLMILGTLPRILSPGEEIELPVNVFAMEDDVKNVKVEIDASKIFEMRGSNKQRLSFSSTGEELARFKLKVKKAIGTGQVKIKATSGSHSANYTIDIKVENPNPVITETSSELIGANKSIAMNYKPIGMRGTNKAFIEVSSIPPIDLSRRLEYLIRYPYGCVEQTTSSAFPQLYLDLFMDLTAEEQKDISRNVRATISSLRRMQISNGGFSYWPGRSYASTWGTNYAGHFLTEARKKGYNVPKNVLQRWYEFQKKEANSFDFNRKHLHRSDLVQAYRLYTLANYGKPSMGAMNRLKAKPNLDPQVSWMLAASYAKAGHKNIAKQMLSNTPERIASYEEFGYTYGSTTRDYAIAADALVLAGQSSKAFSYIRELSETLSSDRWLSTQTIAYSLFAISSYLEKNNVGDKLEYDLIINGQKKRISQSKPLNKTELEEDKFNEIAISNQSGSNIYVRMVRIGKPMENPIASKQRNLYMNVTYMDMQGNKIDPTTLTQGTDFQAEVTVSNSSAIGNLQELALEQVFPGGWEITGMRLQNGMGREMGSDYFDYQDVRDDRVNTFFDLNRGSKKTFKVSLNASYVGRFYHPVTQCKTMYSNSVYAYKSGYWINVVQP